MRRFPLCWCCSFSCCCRFHVSCARVLGCRMEGHHGASHKVHCIYHSLQGPQKAPGAPQKAAGARITEARPLVIRGGPLRPSDPLHHLATNPVEFLQVHLHPPADGVAAALSSVAAAAAPIVAVAAAAYTPHCCSLTVTLRYSITSSLVCFSRDCLIPSPVASQPYQPHRQLHRPQQQQQQQQQQQPADALAETGKRSSSSLRVGVGGPLQGLQGLLLVLPERASVCLT